MQLTEQRIREIVREELAAQQTANIQKMIEIINSPETIEAFREQITRCLVDSLQVADGTP